MGERVTKRIDNVIVYVGDKCNYEYTGDIAAEMSTDGVRDILSRLAYYEDREETAKPPAIENVPTHFYGMEIEKAIEVVKAYKEDRAELLPCPVGAKAWLLLEKEHGVFEIVESQFLTYKKSLKYEAFSFYIDCAEIGYALEFTKDAFGKEVFFSYSDAVKMRVSKTFDVPISVLYNPKTAALFEAFLNNGEVKDENGSLSPEIKEKMLNDFLKGAEE